VGPTTHPYLLPALAQSSPASIPEPSKPSPVVALRLAPKAKHTTSWSLSARAQVASSLTTGAPAVTSLRHGSRRQQLTSYPGARQEMLPRACRVDPGQTCRPGLAAMCLDLGSSSSGGESSPATTSNIVGARARLANSMQQAAAAFLFFQNECRLLAPLCCLSDQNGIAALKSYRRYGN
jgi:hypothetical protein